MSYSCHTALRKNSFFNHDSSTIKENNIPIFNTYKNNKTKKLIKENIEGKNFIKKGRMS